jgi:predicted DNA-binding protein (MmcQ/YjbR family)
VSPETFHAVCASLRGATLEVLWQVDQVYKVGGRMFAALEPNGSISFKANDVAFEMLAQTGLARPAPYSARAKWVCVDVTHALPDEDLRRYLEEAHALIAARLTRKLRRELGLDEWLEQRAGIG